MTNKETAEAMKTAMEIWDEIVKDVKKAFPGISPESVYKISSVLMNEAIERMKITKNKT